MGATGGFMTAGGSGGGCGGGGAFSSPGEESDDWNKTDDESENVRKMRQIREMSLADKKAQFKDI